MARQSPAAKAAARVQIGQHGAEVDTTGMDPEDKAFFSGEGKRTRPKYGVEAPPWMKSIGRTVQGMFGQKPPGRPAAPHPAPAKPPTTSAEADSIYNKYVK